MKAFLNGILSASKAFIYEKISLNDRGLLYIAIQVNAQIREMKATMQGSLSVDEVETVLQNSPAIKDIKCEIIQNHQLTIEKIEELQRQILIATKENETANSIKEKLITWNNRQIKNLGDRYLPEINIPVGLENALNGLSLSEAFAESFLSRIDDFLIEMRKSYISELVPYIDQLSNYAASINFFNLTTEVLSPIKEILSKMELNVLIMRMMGMSYNEITLALQLENKSVDNAVQRIRKKVNKSKTLSWCAETI